MSVMFFLIFVKKRFLSWGKLLIFCKIVYKKLPVNPLVKLITNRRKIERAAQTAGLKQLFSYHKVLRIKEASGLAVCFGLILMYKYGVPSPDIVWVGVVGGWLALGWPEMYLARKGVFVLRQAQKDLPRLIDMLCLKIAGGKSVELALKDCARHARGLWRQEFSAAVAKMNLGLTLEQAFEKTTPIAGEDFKKFLAAFKQAQMLGVSLQETLAVQSDLLRLRRKARAEERARVAAVTMAVPLVLCIFPSLLIIYLAPVVLKVLTVL